MKLMNRTNTVHRNSSLPTQDAALDRLLQEAAGRDWPGPNRNPRIEEFLMNQIADKKRSRRLAMFLGLGTLLATGAVFGAARLYEEYSVRVVCDNGQTYEGTFVANADGSGTMDVTLADGSPGQLVFVPAGQEGELAVSGQCDLSNEPCDLGKVAPADGQITVDCTGCTENHGDKPCTHKPESK